MKKILNIRGRFLLFGAIGFYLLLFLIHLGIMSEAFWPRGVVDTFYECKLFGTDPHLPSGVPYFVCLPNIFAYGVAAIPLIYVIGWVWNWFKSKK